MIKHSLGYIYPEPEVSDAARRAYMESMVDKEDIYDFIDQYGKHSPESYTSYETMYNQATDGLTSEVARTRFKIK